MANYQDIVGLRLGRAQLTTSYATIYTCPTGKRAYIKDINLCNTHSAKSHGYVSIVPSGQTAGAAYELLSNKGIDAYDNYHWTGLQILNEGDTIQAKGSDSNYVTIFVSGAEAV